MPSFFNQLRKKVMGDGHPEEQESSKEASSNDTVDNLIALGVLLWMVAEADEQFLPEERDKIGEVLNAYGEVSDEDMPIVLRAIEEASFGAIDLYTFTSEVGNNLAFSVKVSILENLFRIACVDRDLDHEEHEMIRKISGLLKIEHKDFINTKIKIKKEFGLDTAGL